VTVYTWFVAFTALLSGVGGYAALRHSRDEYEAQLRRELESRRRSVGALALMTEHKRRTLTELEEEVRRPMFGDPDHTEIVNVASLNQQAGITAGRVWADPDIDRRWRDKHGLPEPPPGPIVLDGVAPGVTVDTRQWPDRHPALYRHLPWPVRRSIITHYLKENDA